MLFSKLCFTFHVLNDNHLQLILSYGVSHIPFLLFFSCPFHSLYCFYVNIQIIQHHFFLTPLKLHLCQISSGHMCLGIFINFLFFSIGSICLCVYHPKKVVLTDMLCPTNSLFWEQGESMVRESQPQNVAMNLPFIFLNFPFGNNFKITEKI